MTLIPGICPNCGATLEIDGDKDAAICRYCDTPFVVEKAVKLYNNTYNIHGEVVNIFGGLEKDFLIRGGVLEKYNGEATEVIIPDNVKAIGNKAFAGLQIAEISFPKGVESIGDQAFAQCDKLQKVQLPTGLKSLGEECFASCSMLREISLPNTLEKMGKRCFFSCTHLLEITIPNGIKEVPGGCFQGCTSLKNVTYSENLLSIGYVAFGDCIALESISLPSTLQYIENNHSSGDDYYELCSFTGCKNLKNIVLPFDPQKVYVSSRMHINEESTRIQDGIIRSLYHTPWGRAQWDAWSKAYDEALENRKCPYCGSKLSFFFRKCKVCNKEFPK